MSYSLLTEMLQLRNQMSPGSKDPQPITSKPYERLGAARCVPAASATGSTVQAVTSEPDRQAQSVATPRFGCRARRWSRCGAIAGVVERHYGATAKPSM